MEKEENFKTAKKVLKAKCLLCGSEFTKAGMTKHLQSCLPKDIDNSLKQKGLKIQPFFHMLVAGFYLPEYWLHLKVKSDCGLKDLDQFLRDIWLECCGHMSAFSYQRNELPMDRKIKNVLSLGMEMLYEYDFGVCGYKG